MPDCRKCGACCIEQVVPVTDEDQTPRELTRNFSGLVVMRRQGERCVALEGRVGTAVNCRIYDRRPVVCQALVPGCWACIDLRREHGLE